MKNLQNWLIAALTLLATIAASGMSGYFKNDKGTGERVRAVEVQQDNDKSRFGDIDRRFDGVDRKLESMDKKLDDLKRVR